MRSHAKFLVAVVAAGLAAAFPVLNQGGPLSADDWVNVVVLGVGALHVLVAPNVPHAPATKTSAATLTAVLVLGHNVLTVGNHLGSIPWWQAVLAVAGAFAVYLVPNSSPAV